MALSAKDRLKAVGDLTKKPWARIGVVGILVMGGTVGVLLGFDHKDKASSSVPTPPRVGANSMGDAGTPAYNSAVHQANAERAAQADKEFGASAIPTPILDPKKAPAQEQDPQSTQQAFFGKEKAPEQKEGSQQQQQQVTQQGGNQRQEQKSSAAGIEKIDKIQTLMEKRMAELDKREADRYGPSASLYVTASATSAGGQGQPGGESAKAETTVTKKVRLLEKSGTTELGTNLKEVNSDNPGQLPVLVTLMSGPLKGCTARGNYTASEQGMVGQMKFIDCDAKTYPVDAYLVSMDGKFSFEDDVDHHYVERIVLPAAAAFLSGYGQAAGQQTTQLQYNAGGTVQTLTTSALSPAQELWKAGGAVGTSLGTYAQQQASALKTTRTKDPNSPVGILFVSNLEEDL